mgnify:CR=1 FL=1
MIRPERLSAEAPLERDAAEPFWRVAGSEFGYSDGAAVEASIYAQIKAAADRSCASEELRACITDWPTEYYFSPLRGNLLRHVGIGRGDRVLELGAGCGAITRFLGETGAAVTAVEGSADRARCAAARCADLDNVAVHCGPFAAFRAEPKFDYVLLIGVLEYAPRFYAGPDPLGQCLATARRWLRPGGELVVAIENKLGLKYLLGAEEDHHGKPFYGVSEGYRTGEALTLGREELADAVRARGFGDVRFDYPFPDYKLPAAVVTQAGFRDARFDPSDLLRHVRGFSPNQPAPQLPFDLRRAWRPAVKNRLAEGLSNSFLLRARERAAGDAGRPIALAFAYAAERAGAFATATRFEADPAAGGVRVVKTRLRDGPARPAVGLEHRLATTDWVAGTLLETEVLDAVNRRDGDAATALLAEWRDLLLRTAALDPAAGLGSRATPGAIDCLPRNLVRRPGGELVPIDEEWTLRRDFSINTVVLRYLGLIEHHLRRAARTSGDPRLGPRGMAEALGLNLDERARADFEATENFVRGHVTPWLPPVRAADYFEG